MSAFLFVRIRLHVTYTNKFLGSDQVTTFLITPTLEECTRPWSKMTSPMTQNRVHVTCGHVFLRAHTRKSVRSTDPSDFVGSSYDHCNWSFTHPETHSGLGCVWNMKVCALGSDTMLREHILLFNSCPSLSPSCDQTLLPRFHSTFRWREAKRDQMCRKIVFFTNFVRFENLPFPICVCSKSCNSVITHPRPTPLMMFLINVVLLEIPYPQMVFLW
jgi:hypothetical protein